MEKINFNEKWVLLTLAGIQFTHILDFVIIMPLGPQFMRVFQIDPQEFGFIISSYTFSAGFFGILGTTIIDKFDRKAVLNSAYLGFILGTFYCAIADTYSVLLIARILSGAFGGILGAMTLAIVGDLIPYERRGKATSIIMSSFSLATVMGVPVGLYLATKFSWKSPFIAITMLSAIILVISHLVMPSVRSHIQKRSDVSLLKNFWNILKEKNHIKSFGLISMMMFAGFSVIPFISPYLVANVKISESDLPFVYLMGGGVTFFTARIIGILSDKFGKKEIFSMIALISILPTLLITNLPQLPLHLALAVTTLFFVFVSGRFIPAMTLMTGSVVPEKRGGFMSLNSSIQQISSGIASTISGAIIVKSNTGELLHYWKIGILATIATLICIYLARQIQVVSQSPPESELNSPLEQGLD
jgi:predicted MFS family arabinose efflux permease